MGDYLEKASLVERRENGNCCKRGCMHFCWTGNAAPSSEGESGNHSIVTLRVLKKLPLFAWNDFPISRKNRLSIKFSYCTIDKLKLGSCLDCKKLLQRERVACCRLNIFRHIIYNMGGNSTTKMVRLFTPCLPIVFTFSTDSRLRIVSENPKMFVWTRRMQFWQPCRKLFTTCTKIFCSKSKNQK